MEDGTAAALGEALAAACARLLGAAAAHTQFRGAPVPREAVRAAAGRDRRGADLQATLPVGTFRRMQVAARRAEAGGGESAPVAATEDGGVRVTVLSEFGFEHQRDFASPAALGEALLQEVELPPQLVVDARVASDGALYFVTRLCMERQRGLGQLLCTACGTFCAG